MEVKKYPTFIASLRNGAYRSIAVGPNECDVSVIPNMEKIMSSAGGEEEGEISGSRIIGCNGVWLASVTRLSEEEYDQQPVITLVNMETFETVSTECMATDPGDTHITAIVPGGFAVCSLNHEAFTLSCSYIWRRDGSDGKTAASYATADFVIDLTRGEKDEDATGGNTEEDAHVVVVALNRIFVTLPSAFGHKRISCAYRICGFDDVEVGSGRSLYGKQWRVPTNASSQIFNNLALGNRYSTFYRIPGTNAFCIDNHRAKAVLMRHDERLDFSHTAISAIQSETQYSNMSIVGFNSLGIPSDSVDHSVCMARGSNFSAIAFPAKDEPKIHIKRIGAARQDLIDVPLDVSDIVGVVASF